MPSNVELIQSLGGLVTLYLNYVMKNPPKSDNIEENDADFPFVISPPAGFSGKWSNSSRFFYAKSKQIKSGTTYRFTIKEKVNGVSIPNGGQSFTLSGQEVKVDENGWEEKMQFIIPIELELPEEILPVVKNIKASLLIE